MQVGFKINLGNYEMMSVLSSEHDKWENCMKENFDFLLSIQHPAVQKFAKSFVDIKVQEPAGKKRIRRRE
ncbi:hypothetical protein KAX02_06405 [candidate division WOR-3 bacterium]|nr:hypothetical protein [candidate division WOR-3 bacterium]